MLEDVVANFREGGICKHFSDLFDHGQGFFRSVLHAVEIGDAVCIVLSFMMQALKESS